MSPIYNILTPTPIDKIIYDEQKSSPTRSPKKSEGHNFLQDHSFNPIELYWENLSIIATYKAKKKGFPPCSSVMKSKLILDNVTGIARPGTFTAILGPSGS